VWEKVRAIFGASLLGLPKQCASAKSREDIAPLREIEVSVACVVQMRVRGERASP